MIKQFTGLILFFLCLFHFRIALLMNFENEHKEPLPLILKISLSMISFGVLNDILPDYSKKLIKIITSQNNNNDLEEKIYTVVSSGMEVVGASFFVPAAIFYYISKNKNT